MKMKKNETIILCFAKIENLLHQIRLWWNHKWCGYKNKILGTLPPKYKNFRPAWLSVDDRKQFLLNFIAGVQKMFRLWKFPPNPSFTALNFPKTNTTNYYVSWNNLSYWVQVLKQCIKTHTFYVQRDYHSNGRMK